MLGQPFNLKPSLLYICMASLVLSFSCVIVIILPITVYFKIPIMIALLWYGSWILFRFGFLKSTHSIIQIKRQQDNSWLVHTTMATYVANLRGDSTVTQVVSVLRFQIQNNRFPLSCLVFCDSLPYDCHRKLLVVLRNL